MSEKSQEQQFWQLVDSFIESANAQSETMDPGIVASAMLQAAARYSAFYVAGSSESRKDLKEDKNTLIADISREFKKQFADNLEDYIENYKIYLPEQNDEEL